MHNSEFKIQKVRTRLTRPCVVAFAFCVLHFALSVGVANAQQPNFLTGFGEAPLTPAGETPAALKAVTFKQRLDSQIPLDAAFMDESGRRVTLGEYFRGTKPVVLAFVYYQCPMLCTQVLNGISSAVKALPFEPGEDFDVVLVSFDPRDTPATAAEKKRAHLAYWSTESAAPAWHFLTGDEATIRRVTAAGGFTYQWDVATEQFAHVSGLLVLTPGGRFARYFYGVEYSPRELRMALVEAGQGRIGSPIDELLLYCFHYDPENGRYGVVVMNLIRIVGVLTVAAMAGFMLLMRRRDTHAHAEGHA